MYGKYLVASAYGSAFFFLRIKRTKANQARRDKDSGFLKSTVDYCIQIKDLLERNAVDSSLNSVFVVDQCSFALQSVDQKQRVLDDESDVCDRLSSAKGQLSPSASLNVGPNDAVLSLELNSEIDAIGSEASNQANLKSAELTII